MWPSFYHYVIGTEFRSRKSRAGTRNFSSASSTNILSRPMARSAQWYVGPGRIAIVRQERAHEIVPQHAFSSLWRGAIHRFRRYPPTTDKENGLWTKIASKVRPNSPKAS